MGKKKSENILWLLGHLAIQFIAFLPFTNFRFALSNIIIHGIIDWNIWRLYKISAYYRIKTDPNNPLYVGSQSPDPWRFWEDHWFYATIGFDQLLHGLTLIYLANLFL